MIWKLSGHNVLDKFTISVSEQRKMMVIDQTSNGETRPEAVIMDPLLLTVSNSAFDHLVVHCERKLHHLQCHLQ